MADDGLRLRKEHQDSASKETQTDQRPTLSEEKSKTSKQQESDSTDDDVLTFEDILRIIIGLVVISCALSFFFTGDTLLWGWRPWILQRRAVIAWLKGPIQLSDLELVRYDGTDTSLPIYLALNGTIYDVTAGSQIYGPGGSYHVFAGKDATRGFITGCFAEDATPDIRGVEWTFVPTDVPSPGEPATAAQKNYREQQLRKANRMVGDAIEGWQKLFSGNGGKPYFEVGKVVREQGWLQKMPQPTLCAVAERKRPKAEEEARDTGKAFRGG